MEDADEEQGTAIENVPQQGVQAPICSFEAGASNSAISLFGRVNISNSTVYMGSPSENRGNRLLKPSPSVDIDTIEFTELKEYYKTTLCQASPLPWYPEYTWDIDEVYTELALQNSVTSKFGVEELFKHAHEHSRKGGSYRILIEGDAGYGKSTLMLKIASDWSKRDSNDHSKYTSPFSILFVAKLGYVGKNGKILSYMESIYNEKMDTPLKDVLKSKAAEEVLILLDGYDEANTNTKKEVGRIMKKEMMSKCHVVLTSRCGHVPDDVKGNALRVTLKGFGRRQLTMAVGKFFIMSGHVTKADVISCAVEPVPLRESDSNNESDDSDSDNSDSDNSESDNLDSDNELIASDSDSEFDDSNSDSEIDDPIVSHSDDFKNVQEIFQQLPKKKRLGLEQFKIFMKKVLNESPYKELARCPLLCVMLCCLVSECPNDELPSTCSGLYFAMINRNLYRAARKKAGEVDEIWNLSVLDSRIRKGHESYLHEFGRLCIDGLKIRSMCFTLFDITRNEEAARITNVKVTQLIEAGVLVQDTNEKIPRCQVPHRTTAEFLAAYYLSTQTNPDIFQHDLLDLYRLGTSFEEVASFLLEMGKQRCLADAFGVIKLDSGCLTLFMKSYFTQHGAAGTWSVFKDALPNHLRGNFGGRAIKGWTVFTNEGDVVVGSAEPSVIPLQMLEELGKVNTGNSKALRYSLPKHCPVSLHVGIRKQIDALQFPILLQTVFKSGVELDSLACTDFRRGRDETSDQWLQESVRSLQELLTADSCPVQLSFITAAPSLQLVVHEAMQKLPEACRLKSFQFFQEWHRNLHRDSTQLSEVLAEKWLSHLQHLGIGSEMWGSGDSLNPLLKRLTEPGCSLTSLHLRNCNRYFDNGRGPLLEDLMMLASKLETLKLQGMDLYFDVSRISKYVVKEKSSLKSLHLQEVSLTLNGLLPPGEENKELILSWRSVALNLEELSIDDCTSPIELSNWLNLTARNLRSVSIGRIHKKTPSNAIELGANQLLEALTRSSGDSIKDLSLKHGFWESCGVLLMLHPIREALQRCPRLKTVNLGMNVFRDLSCASIGPDPSTPLSSSDVDALKSNNIYLALFKIVLSVPKLQTLTSDSIDYFEYWEKSGIFHAIADKAKKWPGKRNDNECNTTLTLRGLTDRNAIKAMQVFRERELKYCLSYVTDKVYELWFPV